MVVNIILIILDIELHDNVVFANMISRNVLGTHLKEDAMLHEMAWPQTIKHMLVQTNHEKQFHKCHGNG